MTSTNSTGGAGRPSDPGPPRGIMAWPLGFRLLAAYTVMALLASQAFTNFLTPYLRESGIPVQVIGIYYGLVGALGAFAATLGGWVADTRGRRAAMLLGDGCRFVGWSLLLLFPGRTALLLVTGLVGMGWAAGSAFQAMVAELAPPGRRALGFAITTSLESVAGMIVPVLVGLAADRFGLRVALGFGLVPAAVSLWWIRRLPETREHPETSMPSPVAGQARLTRPSPWAGLRFALSPEGRGARMMGVIWWVTVFQFSLVGPARPLYVVDRFGVSWSGLGAVATLGALGSVIGPIIGGRIADRVGYAKLMAICLTGSGVIGLAIPLAGTPTLYAVLLMFSNLVGWTAAPCWGAVSAASAPRAVRGSVGGLFAALRALGGAVGGALVGFMYARSIAAPLYAFAVLDLSIVILVLWARRRGWPGFGSAGWA